MFFYRRNSFVIKFICLTLSIFLVLSMFVSSNAESYEWTVVNNIDTIETNNTIQNEEGSTSENTLTPAKDELNLDCGSAILIEQTTRPNIIRKKCT